MHRRREDGLEVEAHSGVSIFDGFSNEMVHYLQILMKKKFHPFEQILKFLTHTFDRMATVKSHINLSVGTTLSRDVLRTWSHLRPHSVDITFAF